MFGRDMGWTIDPVFNFQLISIKQRGLYNMYFNLAIESLSKFDIIFINVTFWKEIVILNFLCLSLSSVSITIVPNVTNHQSERFCIYMRRHQYVTLHL